MAISTVLKTKTVSVVEQQLPKFVQENNQTFIDFLKLYYQFLEQNLYAQGNGQITCIGVNIIGSGTNFQTDFKTNKIIKILI